MIIPKKGKLCKFKGTSHDGKITVNNAGEGGACLFPSSSISLTGQSVFDNNNTVNSESQSDTDRPSPWATETVPVAESDSGCLPMTVSVRKLKEPRTVKALERSFEAVSEQSEETVTVSHAEGYRLIDLSVLEEDTKKGIHKSTNGMYNYNMMLLYNNVIISK